MTTIAEEDNIQQREIFLQMTLKAKSLREPLSSEKVYKDDCIYCFRTPFFPNGLYVCLTNFVGVCRKHIDEYAKNNGSVFLNIKYEKREKNENEEPKDKIARIDIAEDIEKTYTVCLYPYLDVELSINQNLIGGHLTNIVDKVILHLSADVQTRMENGACDWDGAALLETEEVHNLVQLDVKKTEPSDGWICEEPGCGFRSNLWLNLSDGAVMCGRGQIALDGNGHALKHARETGFCLVVRLGTIQNGTGEVFYYDFEDEKNEGFVRNPYLKQHLAHFGLDIDNFQKTEQNFIELEKNYHFKHDWNVIQEEGLNLEPKYGPGFTGLINMGSTCYINSLLQTLLAIPDFVELYDKNWQSFFSTIGVRESYNNFNCQLAKVLHSLNSSDDFSKENSKLNRVEPRQFRDVAGQNHSEFSTAKQQDVEHYIRHLFELIDKSVPKEINPVNAVRFKLLERFEDIASGQVRYNSHDDIILSLTIPIENFCETSKINPESEFYQNSNIEEINRRETILLEQCLLKTFGDDIIEDYTSPVTGEKKGAKQTISLASFPDFLFVQLKRFTYDLNGEQKKLNVDVENVDELFLETFRSQGLQANEIELSEDGKTFSSLKLSSSQDSSKNLRELETLKQLRAMGFGENASRKAIRFTNNESIQIAADWIIKHIYDPTINDPEPEIFISPNKETDVVMEESINKLVDEFQFTPHQAKYGLKQTNGNLNAAINWLFENIHKVPEESSFFENTSSTTSETMPVLDKPVETAVRDGKGKYRLRGFISHIGKNPNCGHYVVHLEKDNIWYIYNDEKVCISQKPPKSCGYVYLYERTA